MSKHSEYLRTNSRTDNTQLPGLTIIAASPILSQQKQQIPREDSCRAPPPAHSSPALLGEARPQLFLMHTFMAANSCEPEC